MKFEIIPNEQTPCILENQVDEFMFIQEEKAKIYIEEHRKELEAFLDFASQQKNAVGLAANQVSVDGNRFMVRAFALKNMNDGIWSLVIDPVVDVGVGMCEYKVEGCLTWKDKKIIAERYRAVRVDYFDMDGVRHEGEVYKGFEGQIWQHEINHLNGVAEQVEEPSYPSPKQLSPGRNDECPCGSGLKYKKCCLKLL